ncbi:MAG: sigma-70 family RNA polymerase sigma factor [Bacteroidota bacterium]
MSSGKPENTEEQSLIRRYQQSGDLDVLGKLYGKYMHLVYGVCLKYLKNREDSQDAVMQIFEKVVVSLIDSDVQNFKSWLFVVTKNFCLMKLRSSNYKQEQRQQDINEAFVENSLVMHPLNEDGEMESDLSKLEVCIEQLKLEQKTCVRMFYIEKKTYVEIVEMTNYDLKKVKSYIQNGKRNLKLCMNS